MRWWGWAGLLLVVAGGLGLRYAVAERELETPEYSVIVKDGPFEVRTYSAYLVAEVSVSGERSTAANQGFEILAGYIFGANRSRQDQARSENIAMTSPVLQIPATSEQWKVQFMMPGRFSLETLPIARDERIRFFSTRPQKVLALRFSGDWSEANLKKHRSLLAQYARDHEMDSPGEPFYAFYNAPFVPPGLRRNEVMLKLDP